MSEIVEIATVFKAVFAKRPLPPLPHFDGDPPDDWITERARREKHVLAVICAELHATGAMAILVAGGQRIDLPARDLREAPAHHICESSKLITAPWVLRAYAAYQQAVVFIPDAVKERAIKTVTKELGVVSTRGRPSKRNGLAEKYQARFPNGHKAEGISWYQAIREIDATVGPDTLKRALGLK
ncbi:MAG: hypothetical protein LC676_08005 [Loktanella sp.]|nr:hypothetical protein [Loktanella sp.]